MLDIKLIRKDPDIVRKDLKKRGDKEKQEWLDDLLKKDEEYRKLQTQLDGMRSERNIISKKISEYMKTGKTKEAELAKKTASELPDQIKEAEERVEELGKKIRYYLMRLPNILHDDVPLGENDNDNKVLRTWGDDRKITTGARSHVDMLTEMDLGDTERAAKVSGSRFYYLKNDLVLLDMALMRMAMDIMVDKGFTPIMPPLMMRKKPYEGVTDLSDFENVMYKIEGEDLYLIATSEHPLAAMHMDEIIPEEDLPLKYAGYSPCFRKEAGTHGKDTKGIFRVHQFNKIEQYVFCKPEDSWKIFGELLETAEEMFRALEIPHRVVDVCTGDIGIVAARKQDIEAWMPAQNKYKEVVSCSNVTSYQAVRLNLKYGKVGGEKEYLHTLNSTTIATPRAIVAIMENHQQPDGSINIPEALRKYMGKDKIVGKE